MTKKVLLTRSYEDNEKLVQLLSKKGYDCINFSLIDHVSLFTNFTVSSNYSDIIVTSKRAAQVLAPCNHDKNAWVVGNSSADILRKKNYNIKYVAESAFQLKEVLPKSIYSKAIYLRGNFITIDMPSKIETLEVYKVSYRDSVSEKEVSTLKNGVNFILLYSENCAKTLVKLIVRNDLLKYLENSVIIVISSKVEVVVKEYFKRTIVAAKPEEKIYSRSEVL